MFSHFFGSDFCGPGPPFLEAFWSQFVRLFLRRSENGELRLDCTGVSESHIDRFVENSYSGLQMSSFWDPFPSHVHTFLHFGSLFPCIVFSLMF